ncbi:MAG: YicC family protein [Ignavibacteriales bacterium]|nr:YicC family protein [Ignavibacteriales bacterium]
MISSMTGYGKAIVQRDDITVEAELKSLNSRYLDLSLRIPKFLMNKEFEIREKVKNRIKRGKVYLAVSIRKGEIEERFNEIDPAGVKYALSLLKDIKKFAKIKGNLKLSDVLLFQNMLFKDDYEQAGEEFEIVVEAIDSAVNELNKMREAEGKELEKDLRKRVQMIGKALSKIENSSEESIKAYFEKIKEKAKQLVADLSNNQDRLNMELALIAERADVTEECVRLRSHIKMFLDTISKSDDAGRKLNFIVQEMNREANTINSKSVSSEISHNGISIKEEIEKIREQIQNIE